MLFEQLYLIYQPRNVKALWKSWIFILIFDQKWLRHGLHITEFFRVMYQLSDGSVNDDSNSAIDPHMLRYEVAKFSNRFATYQ